MELIERYVHAVGKHIRKKNRADIEKELKSLILDQLDAKSKGQPYAQEDIITVLKEMGQPWVVAATYNSTDKGLIGPRLLETYFLILKIVLGALALGLLIANVIRIVENPSDIGMIIFKMLGEILSGGMATIGWVTVIFAVIERTAPDFKEFKPYGKDWNPKDLPLVPRPVDQIKLSESIVALIFIVAAVVIFNFFYDKIGIYHTPKIGEPLQFIPLIEKGAYLKYLPFWNVLWALELIRHIILIALGREVLPTRIYSLILPVLSIFVIAMMLGGPSILVSNIAGPGFSQTAIEVSDVISTIYRIVLIVALVGTVIDIIKRIFFLIRSLH